MKNNTLHKLSIIGFLLWIFFTQSIYAKNILKLGSYSTAPATEFSIAIEADNSDPFIAFQVDIPVPTGFVYVNNSAVLNSARISGHAIIANMVSDNVLRILGYSTENKNFLGNAGTLVNFKLKSGTVPGSFSLSLNQATMADNNGNNILNGTLYGEVSVLAPNIKLSKSEINFGRVALKTSAEVSFVITNDGNRDLVINKLVFDDSQFSTNTGTILTLAANTSKSINVKFTPSVKSLLSNKLQIFSNDPDQPTEIVLLNAVAFAVNEIHTGNIIGASSSTAKLEFSIFNMEAFTGFQFDIQLPSPMTYLPGSTQLFRSMDHTVSVNPINESTLRVMVFSPANKNFTGIDGKVLGMEFSLKGLAGNYNISMSNVIIASTSGENIVSSSFGGSLRITSPDIDAPTNLNFGDVSIFFEGNKNLRIYNYGQEPLTITQLLFSDEYFKSNQILPLIIQPNQYIDLPVKFSKTTKDKCTGVMKIVSNDPDENPVTVQLSANAFAPNYLLIKDQIMDLGERKLVAVEIENEEAFVAFQFDLIYPNGLIPDMDAIALTSRSQDHIISTTAISTNTIRILAYSISQKAFLGKTGAVLSIPFICDNNVIAGTYPIKLANAIISNESSENILYSNKNGNITIKPGNTSAISKPTDDILDINVYPNPTTGVIYIDFGITPEPKTWITVLNIPGKVVSKSMVTRQVEKIDLTGNTNGVYFLMVGQKVTRVYRVILEKK
jgi:hypothetical protein